jgi:hypothetical protein
MASYRDFLDALEKGITDLLKTSAKDFTQEARSDAKDFLKKAEEDLKRWTKLLQKDQLTKDDFEWLVKGKEALAQMRALKLAGLTQVRIDRLRKSIINLVIDTAFAVFL